MEGLNQLYWLQETYFMLHWRWNCHLDFIKHPLILERLHLNKVDALSPATEVRFYGLIFFQTDITFGANFQQSIIKR